VSAPFVWVILPIFFSFILYILRKNQPVVGILSIGLSFLLFASSLTIPIQENVGENSRFGLNPSLTILGREFLLISADKYLIALFYLMVTLWNTASFLLEIDPLFFVFSIASSALAVAAYSVTPFIYASLLIGFISILAMPVLSSYSSKQENVSGLFRFFSYQLLSIPFLLLAGWFLAGGEIAPVAEQELVQASVLLGLGFAFMLAFFPFHIWTPILADGSIPIHFSFITRLIFQIGFFLLLKFINNFSWLREFQVIYPALRVIGLVMVVISGMWSFFAMNLRKIIAYYVLLNNGLLILAISTIPEKGPLLFSIILLTGNLSLVGISWAAQNISKYGRGFSLDQIIGLYKKIPFTVIIFIIGLFSLWGSPLTAGFWPLQFLISSLNTYSASFVVFTLLGLLFAAMTSMRVLFRVFSPERPNEMGSNESLPVKIFSIFLSLIIILMGIFPKFATIYAMELIQPFGMLLK